MSLNWKAGIVALSLSLSVYAGAYAFDMDHDVQRATEQENQMYSIALGMNSEEVSAALKENMNEWRNIDNNAGDSFAFTPGKDITTTLMSKTRSGQVDIITVNYLGESKEKVLKIYKSIKSRYSEKYGEPDKMKKGTQGVPTLAWISKNQPLVHILLLGKSKGGSMYEVTFGIYRINNTNLIHYSQQSSSASNSNDSVPTFTV